MGEDKKKKNDWFVIKWGSRQKCVMLFYVVHYLYGIGFEKAKSTIWRKGGCKWLRMMWYGCWRN